MITELLNNIFDESKIKEESRVDYIILCDYFEIPKDQRTFRCKHLKKLKKKFKKEIEKASK